MKVESEKRKLGPGSGERRELLLLTKRFKAACTTAFHKLTVSVSHSSSIKKGLDILELVFLFGSFVVIPTLLHRLSKSLQQLT